MVRVGPRGQTNAIAYGFGSVWVSYDDEKGDHLARVDATTSEVTAQVGLEGGPSWAWGGGGLTVGAGRVWITGSFPGGARLLEVDPATNKVVTSVDFGSGFGADVAVVAGGVWVLVIGAGGGQDVMRLVRVDPDTHRVVAMMPLPYGYGHFLYAVGDRLIAQTNKTRGRMVGHAFLNFVDPQTGVITATQPVRWSLPIVGEDQAWVSTNTGLAQLDSSDGSVLRRFVVPYARTWIAAVGDGGVWFFDKHAVLHHLNAATGAVDVSVPTREVANTVASSPTALWLLGYDGTLTRVSIG